EAVLVELAQLGRRAPHRWRLTAGAARVGDRTSGVALLARRRGPEPRLRALARSTRLVVARRPATALRPAARRARLGHARWLSTSPRPPTTGRGRSCATSGS